MVTKRIERIIVFISGFSVARKRRLYPGAHRKISVAARPRALRPPWRKPHCLIIWRVSAVAASGGVSMRRRFVGMIT
jgi:hypothetical protein